MESALQAGDSLRQRPPAVPSIEKQSVALIAHDTLESTIVGFAHRHFGLLAQTPGPVSTNSAGGRLNEVT